MTLIYSTQPGTTTQTTTPHAPINQTSTTPITTVALPKLKLEFTPAELQQLAPHLLKLDASKLDPQILDQFFAQKNQ